MSKHVSQQYDSFFIQSTSDLSFKNAGVHTFVMAFLVKTCTHLSAKRYICLAIVISAATVCWYITNLPPVDQGQHKLGCNLNTNQEIAHRMETEAMETDSTGTYEPLFQNKIVHFDLKGAPPKVAYYAEIFPLLAKLGTTGILMEYEDMFPYSGLSLDASSAKNAYSHADIAQINQLAKENNLEIIPLVQVFGHLEFLLKLPEHVHLREVPDQPQVCFIQLLLFSVNEPLK